MTPLFDPSPLVGRDQGSRTGSEPTILSLDGLSLYLFHREPGGAGRVEDPSGVVSLSYSSVVVVHPHRDFPEVTGWTKGTGDEIHPVTEVESGRTVRDGDRRPHSSW